MLDFDLAELYQVETKRLKEAVRRNIERFEGDDFMFVLSENEYEILPSGHYTAREYQIEPDVSAACYFYAMAAINGGVAKAAHVHFDSSQGDVKFLRVLEKMA